MAATRKNVQPQIAKADVSVPVPGGATRFMVIGGGKASLDQQVLNAGRRAQLGIYYEMYREHPTLRAGIEKIAKVAIATGYMFQPESAEGQLPKERAKEVKLFFRASNGNQLLKATYRDLLIFADAYWWVQRARNGKPIKAKRLHPKFVTIETNGIEVTGYKYGPSADKSITYDPSVILHFKLDDPDNDLYGLSLLHSLMRTVATDLFAMEYNGNFFENSAQTGVIFNMKNTSPEEIERNRAWLDVNYVGAKNAHKPLILEGDVEVSRSISTSKEMEFIEGRKFNREEILSVLDVPASKVAISGDSNRSTSKEDDNTFRSETVAPLQGIVEEEISNSLILGMFGYDDLVFKHREVSKRDMIELTKMLAELERMGVFSVNEIRGELGMAEVDAGDVHFVQTAAGLLPLSMIDEVAARLVIGGVGNNQTPFDSTAPSISDVPFDEAQ